MRLKINLASTPYESAGRFYLQWGVALLVMLAVSSLLVIAAARTWRSNHALSRSITEERDRLDKLNQQEKADLAILNESQNRDVRERSQALNALIVRKSFSWTRIFNDLEKMMPTRLHVVSIAPQLSVNNELQIHMMVAGAREKGVELVQNMEKAPDFRNATIVAENAAGTLNAKPGQPADAVTFDIIAQYTPSENPQPEPAPAASASDKPATPAAEPAKGNATPKTTQAAVEPRPATKRGRR